MIWGELDICTMLMNNNRRMKKVEKTGKVETNGYFYHKNSFVPDSSQIF